MSDDSLRFGIVVGAAIMLALVVATLLALLVAGHFFKLENPPPNLTALLEYVLGALVLIVLGAARAIPKRPTNPPRRTQPKHTSNGTKSAPKQSARSRRDQPSRSPVTV
jgi:hypothetical protein